MKKCFKCFRIKSINEFYAHKEMGDGRLGKCKTCTKKDSRNREGILRMNPKWVEKEKKRGRDKYHRLGYGMIYKPTMEEKRISMDKYKEKYPEKQLAKNSSQSIRRGFGFNLHHWSYNKAHWKDIIELSVKNHNKLHRYIIYDQERKMYRRCDNGQLLDTKKKHIAYYNKIKNKP